MKDANAPDFLWVDTFATVVYATNRTISSCNCMMSPFKAFFGKHPSVSHMHVWYADMFVHHPKDLGAGKLGACAHQVKFLGYPDGTTGYKAYDPHTHHVSIIRAPIFREEAHPHPTAVFESADDDSDEDVPLPDTPAAPAASPTPPPASPPHLLLIPYCPVTPPMTNVPHSVWIQPTLVCMDVERKRWPMHMKIV